MAFYLNEAGVADLWASIDDKYGTINLHNWKRRTVEGAYALVMGGVVQASATNYDSFVHTGAYAATAFDISYADEIEIDDEGNISLVNPSTVSVSQNDYTNASVLAGKYFKKELRNGAGNIVVTQYAYVPVGSTPAKLNDAGNVSNGNGQTINFGGAKVVGMAQQIVAAQYSEEYGVWEYVASANGDAYPDCGVSGGYEYVYCGIPFDNAVTAPKFATGSYTGTGTNGSTNPNSLTFDFAPKMVAIAVNTSSNNMTASLVIVLPKADGGVSPQKGGTRSISAYEYSKYVYAYASEDGKTVYWYSPDGWAHQMNQIGSTYDYFAVG